MQHPSNPAFDINKVIAALADRHAAELFNAGKNVVSDSVASTRAKLKIGYAKYLNKVFKNYSKSKSFFFRDDPVPLYDFYVPLTAATHKNALTVSGIQELARNAPHAIIFATAGQGKSTFMRHLLLGAVTQVERLPVFVELRSLNADHADLIEAVT